MIPLAANIPLALCSVVLRRFIDSYTGRLPLAVVSNSVPTASTVALFSGALVCLYHQLRKGTLIKVGAGKRISSILRNSRHTIQRRMKNNSWFLRNIDSCRRKCAEAVFKIVQPSQDSLESIQVETGEVETGIVGETTSLPIFNRRRHSEGDGRRHVKHAPPLEKLYSNESFDSDEYSTQDVRAVATHKDEVRKGRYSQENDSSSHRPLTRNFRKSLVQTENCGDGRKLPTKKRKKFDPIIKEEEEDDDPVHAEEKEDETSNKEPSQRASGPVSEEPRSAARGRGRRRSDRLKKQPAVQKITRKTRSGRVYAYRL